MISLLDLDPEAYQASPLHDPDRTFRETNCYVDIWIEMLHAHRIDPASGLSFAFRADFEGDQWTFFKPPPADLDELYGIDVHEVQLYRPTVDHAIEQLQSGKTLILEVDSFYLPDTCGTSYRQAHVKSSIAIEAIEPSTKRLRYFHGTGYYELRGEDYRGVFRIGHSLADDVLPPYVEVVNFNAGQRLAGECLRSAVRPVLARNLARRPKRNPWLAFGERLCRDLDFLIGSAPADYHAYAFATVRQCGAAFELGRSFINWFADQLSNHRLVASDALQRQVIGAKSILFKLARQRAFDPAPPIAALAEDWENTMNALDSFLRASGADSS